jgi:hypothetical protein
MESLKDQLKKFISGSHMNHDITYQHYYQKGEILEFGITSRTNDEYFYLNAYNGESSVRGYYKLAGMEDEASIVAELSNVRDDHCEIMFRALELMKIKVVVDSERRVRICLL